MFNEGDSPSMQLSKVLYWPVRDAEGGVGGLGPDERLDAVEDIRSVGLCAGLPAVGSAKLDPGVTGVDGPRLNCDWEGDGKLRVDSSEEVDPVAAWRLMMRPLLVMMLVGEIPPLALLWLRLRVWIGVSVGVALLLERDGGDNVIIGGTESGLRALSVGEAGTVSGGVATV